MKKTQKNIGRHRNISIDWERETTCFEDMEG